MNLNFQNFKSDTQNLPVLKPLIGTSAFKNLKLDQDSSIFSKFRINYNPPNPVTHLVVNNNHLVLAMSNKVLIRIDLSTPNNVEEMDLSKFAPKSKLHKIFLDPNGHHILISIVANEDSVPVDLLYLPWKSSKPKSTYKFKGLLITAIGWNPRNCSENSTGPILFGTSKGLIYELELTSDESLLQSGHERSVRQVYDLSQNENEDCIINDLRIIVCPTDEYLIYCSTSTKLLHFFGYIKSLDERPFYLSIFQSYSNSGIQKNFIKHPNSWPSSFLQLTYIYPSKNPSSYLWIISHYIYMESLKWNEAPSGIEAPKPIPLPECCDNDIPLCGFICTQFHILLVWPEKIMGICLLNNQIVFEEFAPEDSGCFVGIYKDFVKGTIWVFSERSVFKYKVEKEDRNVWHIYLEMGDFGKAKEYCKSNEVKLAYVLIKEAEDAFRKKDFVKSAKLFAKSPSSFEEVCLQFIENKAEDALKIYLMEKLEHMSNNDQTQLTLLTLWLMELLLRKLGHLRDTEQRNSSDYRSVDEEFQLLLREPKVRQCIQQNANSFYSLLASHDDQDNYISVALILKDFNRVVLHLMAHERHAEALEVMSTQNSDQLFYKHTPTLLQVIPKPTIKALISQGRKLNPVILLPALMHAHSTYGLTSDVLSYIEFCVDKMDIKDQVIHNFLVTLYCSENPEKLLSYLKLQGEDGESVNYDVKFALRECMTSSHDVACIHILTTIGYYQEAVEMALRVDTTLAKAIANRVRYDEELCKKLWLMIAAHVIEKEQDVARALEVLKECSLIKIEDILPFFPDFVTINQFKDAICKSLEEYNEHIANLKEEMNEATKTANNIRNDIKKYKKNSFMVRAQDKCCECNYPLLTRLFYLFPCSHKFHQDCLTDAILNSLTETKQKEVSELKGKLIALSSDEETARGVGSKYWNDREQLRAKIDAIVASECLYCGDVAVNSVDKPFISDDEWNSVMEEWQ
ncbi:UNVERIFIED_CONTAM: hypothetical protein RMT77_013758 [Armadillidium vulgare]